MLFLFESLFFEKGRPSQKWGKPLKEIPNWYTKPVFDTICSMISCERVVFIGITFTMLIADEQLSEYNLNRTFDANVCFISLITTHEEY